MAATALVLPYVYATAFGAMSWHDDQGTLMITLRDLMEGRRLYDDEYALYGPFYYLTVGKLFTAVHLPLTHDFVRLVSAGFWLVCTATLALLVHRITRSLAASCFTYLTSLLLLCVFTESPAHPQEIGFLMLASLPLVLWRIERLPSAASLTIVGVIVSAAILTKINLGIFIGAALVLTAIRITQRKAWPDPIFAAAAVAGLLLPLGLMLPLFRFSWVGVYCAFATMTIATAMLVWWRAEVPELLTVRHWGICLASMVGAAVAIIGIVVIGGTTPGAIFNATIVQNQHLLQGWYIEREFSMAAAASAFVAVGAALFHVILDARAATQSLARQGVLWLKLVLSLGVIALIVAAAIGEIAWVLPWPLFQLLVPFSWLVIVPPKPGPLGRPVTRGGIGLLAAFMVLYPFPVNGEQVAIAVALPAAMLPVLLHDALTGLSFRSLSGRSGARWRLGAALLAGLILAEMLIGQTKYAFDNYAAAVPLDLPGARLTRASAQTVATIHWVTTELAPCESLYTMGGGLSFFFWARKPTPTGINSNNPLDLLTWPQQERLIADLDAEPNLCVLRSPELLQLFDRGQIATRPPLLRYIDERFAVVAERVPYELLKRRELPR